MFFVGVQLYKILSGMFWYARCSRVCHYCTSAPKLPEFLPHLFWVGLAWDTVGVTILLSQSFLDPYHHQKASTHAIMSKFLCHFYLWHLPSDKNLILGMLNVYYPC